ncbi:hypothetical protein N302_14351, partial [Corvus brachyrhynchos]
MQSSPASFYPPYSLASPLFFPFSFLSLLFFCFIMAIIIPILLFLAAEPLAPPRHTHAHTHSLTHSHTHAHAAHAPPRSRPPVWEQRRRRSASSSPGRQAHALIHMHEGDSRRREQRRGMARAGEGRYRQEEEA